MAILNAWINGLEGGAKTQELVSDLTESGGIQVAKMFMNGELCYSFFICKNHYGPGFDRFLSFLQDIVEIEGSELHGLVYIYDDEDKQHHDSWQVWSLRKGELFKEKDTYLSPLSTKVFSYPA
jgi:hypothetical protein